MFIKDGKRFNPLSLRGKRAPDGSLRNDYPNTQDLIDLGIEEIAEPAVPEDFSDDLYYRTEQDEAPYVIYTRKSDEQIAAVKMQQAKVLRTQAVQSIVVNTQAGNSFDGNEDAQNRMSRAINGLEDDIETVPWVLADNSLAQVNRTELKEALRLSGAAQTQAWVIPYTS